MKSLSSTSSSHVHLFFKLDDLHHVVNFFFIFFIYDSTGNNFGIFSASVPRAQSLIKSCRSFSRSFLLLKLTNK